MNAFNAVLKGTNVKTEGKTTIGRVWKISEKGWGFIVSQEIPFTKIFFHWTYLIRETENFKSLLDRKQNGDTIWVEFTPIERGKDTKTGREMGIHAIKVRVLEQDEVPSEIRESEVELPVPPVEVE